MGSLLKALSPLLLTGQRTGPLKWCWLPLDDRRSVDTFLRLAGRKAEWLAERIGIPSVALAYTVGGNEQAKDLFALYDDTIARLLAAAK